jgi:protein SCO1
MEAPSPPPSTTPPAPPPGNTAANGPWGTIIAVVIAVAALSGGALAARHFLHTPTAATTAPAADLRTAAVYAEPRALPAVALQALDGTSAEATAALRGSWRVVFFGFTHCPDICPGTLSMLARLEPQLQALPAAARPVVTMVTLDPRRDTAAVLKPYLAFFSPAFAGYTGTEPGIDQLAQAVGVAVIRGKPDANGAYGVDHTAALFILDPDARVRAILPTPHTADGILHDYRIIAGLAAGSAAATTEPHGDHAP